VGACKCGGRVTANASGPRELGPLIPVSSIPNRWRKSAQGNWLTQPPLETWKMAIKTKVIMSNSVEYTTTENIIKYNVKCN